MTLPVWERLRAPDRRALQVGPLQRIEADLVRVVDGDLPDLGGATVFDAWTDASGYLLRAALLTDARATPYLVRAARLEITGSDGRLEALLGQGSVVAAPGELERLACACRGISADAVYRAIGSGWSTVDQLKRSSRIAFGECQGRRCVPWLAERLELPPDDPRAQVRARPPLVPVPASVLAAVAED
jgi:bacterioferritin-associated ferredoxin